MDQRLPSGPYGSYGFTPDGESYSNSDLPLGMRQELVRQGTSFDRGLNTPNMERSIGCFTNSPSYPPFQHHHSTGESDSGIDMNFLGFQPDWSQSSPSSTIAPSNFMHGPTNGISPIAGDMTAQYGTDPTTQALFAARDEARHNIWQSSAQTKHPDEYLAYLPPQARQRYQQPNDELLNCGPSRATIKTDSQYTGLKGNGKHQAFFQCS